jgi:hypothetical protein
LRKLVKPGQNSKFKLPKSRGISKFHIPDLRLQIAIPDFKGYLVGI